MQLGYENLHLKEVSYNLVIYPYICVYINCHASSSYERKVTTSSVIFSRQLSESAISMLMLCWHYHYLKINWITSIYMWWACTCTKDRETCIPLILYILHSFLNIRDSWLIWRILIKQNKLIKNIFSKIFFRLTYFTKHMV